MLFGNIQFQNSRLQQTSNQIQVQKLQSQIIQKINQAQLFLANITKNYPPEQSIYSNITISSFPLPYSVLHPQYNEHTNYYQQFWNIYLKNQTRLNLINNITSQINVLKQNLNQIQKLEEVYLHNLKVRNKKKNRRLSNEIQKIQKCPYEDCYKTYGSDVSLNLHIKIKHNGGNKTERQKLAQQLCLWEIGKGQKPEIALSFPPGFIEEFRKQFTDKYNKK